MGCFSIADLTPQCTQSAKTNPNASTTRHVIDNGRGRSADPFQTVFGLNQNAAGELARRGTDAGHDWGGQRQFECTGDVIEPLHHFQTCFAGTTIFPILEKTHTHQHIQLLRGFVDFAGDSVLDEVLTRQLNSRGITKEFVTHGFDIHAKFCDLFAGVKLKQILIVNAAADVADDMMIETWVSVFAEGIFANFEHVQACCDLGVVRSFRRNQICSRLNQCLMKLRSCHAVKNARGGAHGYGRGAYVTYTFYPPHHDAVVLLFG
ncbi:Uncharacterised protein [Klebsiella pneumoniae]|nr:Uncharacterised protein [Klebsiella pneumoniae]